MKLWLTYAWIDNEDRDVDHVINRLRDGGIDVQYDRATLLAGLPLWDQIADALSDPTLDGWALYTTTASLQSGPCREEFRIALHRAIQERGEAFRLIGIFPDRVEEMLVPPSLKARLYVNLTDPTWRDQIVDTLTGQRRAPDLGDVPAIAARWHQEEPGYRVLEVFPRDGRWLPCHVLVPVAERDLLVDVYQGPNNHCTTFGVNLVGESASVDGALTGLQLHHAVDRHTSCYIKLRGVPSRIAFGPGESLFWIDRQ